MPRLRRLSTVVIASLSACLACTRDAPPPPHDAAPSAAAAPDAGRSARRRRRRRGPSQAGAHASNTAAGAQGSNGVNNAPAEVDDEVDEPPRPRTMPETGPTLTEDLGPPPSASFDMTQSQGEGPIGMDPHAVSRGLDPLLPRFSACAAFATDDQGRGPHGRVTVRLRIRNDGQPLAARVSGGGGSSDFVLCVRRVVASARFSRFNGPDAMASWGFDVD